MRSIIVCLCVLGMMPQAYALTNQDFPSKTLSVDINQTLPISDKHRNQKLLPSDKATQPHDKKNYDKKDHDKKDHNKKILGHKNKQEERHFYHPQIIYTTVIPPGFRSVRVDGQTFYYKAGLFYRLNAQELLPVAAPLGAIVDDIPTDRSSEMIDDVEYSIYNNVFYVMTKEGDYQVVEPPSNYDAAHVTTIADGPDSVIINIPNSKKEGYTTVTLIKSEDGFTGPQGEFYETFPGLSQLKMMYGQ